MKPTVVFSSVVCMLLPVLSVPEGDPGLGPSLPSRARHPTIGISLSIA
jgi:hypothetical protein